MKRCFADVNWSGRFKIILVICLNASIFADRAAYHLSRNERYIATHDVNYYSAWQAYTASLLHSTELP